jgi:hypothetical protein
MKKIWVFILGILSGVVLTIVALLVIGSVMNKNNGINFFDEPGEVVNVSELEVFQVLGDGVALANESPFGMTVYLIYDENGNSYYDNQIVSVPNGKCFRQVGTYKYKANNGMLKTVPVVTLIDGEYGGENDSFDTDMNKSTSQFMREANFFDEPGDVLSNKSFKVSSVLEDGVAIARGKDEIGYYYGLEVVLFDTTKVFYDDQIVKLQGGKVFRQIGTYKYMFHTYPIVSALGR